MKKKRGRPSTRPKDLVGFNAQMSAEAKAKLKALAQVEHTHAYALLESAFWKLWETLPKEKRSAAETIAALTAAPAAKEDVGGR